MTIKLMDDNAALRQEAFMYDISCPVMQAESHEQHLGSTVCLKDFMSVSEAGWLLLTQLLRGKCGLDRAGLQNKIRTAICILLLTCCVALDWFLNHTETLFLSLKWGTIPHRMALRIDWEGRYSTQHIMSSNKKDSVGSLTNWILHHVPGPTPDTRI